MNEILNYAIKKMPQYQKLTPVVAEFFMRYYQMWVMRDGCKESNRYFAELEGVSIKTIEARFKELRNANLIVTNISKYYDPLVAGNPAGFITMRTHRLNPTFAVHLDQKINLIKEKLASQQVVSRR